MIYGEENEVIEEHFIPNKAGGFEGIFSWVKGQFAPPLLFQEELIFFQVYTIVKQSI